MDLKEGDLVVCVNPNDLGPGVIGGLPKSNLKKGQTYIIKEIREGSFGLSFVVLRDASDFGYYPQRFIRINIDVV